MIVTISSGLMLAFILSSSSWNLPAFSLPASIISSKEFTSSTGSNE